MLGESTKTKQLPAAKHPPSAPSEPGTEVLRVESRVRELERVFGQAFFLYDTSTDTLHRVGPDSLGFDIHSRIGVCDQVARRGRPEVIEDFAPLLTLATPLLAGDEASTLVAVCTFVTEPIYEESQLLGAAEAMGVEASSAFNWAQDREVWNPRAVLELAKSLAVNRALESKTTSQKEQLAEVSSHLLSTFKELSMLHRLTERLSIARSESELSELAVQWLADVIPAECFVAVRCVDEHGSDDASGASRAEALTYGPCPIEENQFGQFIERLGPDANRKCLVLNRETTTQPTWYYPAIRELISSPIRSNNRILGWVLAFNHTDSGRNPVEFGAVEASLLSSVAAILGIHAGNCRLFEEQKEFFAAMVKALSSAIDAKDPYTSGHSDRVARLAVCLAKEVGCSQEDLNTIYLAGLLHDIGKIGIEDHVLRKSGKLTAEEFEHIKTHPELGFKILQGVRPLEAVLPIVLHHHEAWNGKGYPSGLAGEESPRLARIVAVADSIDAMSSDRPYRKGMDDKQLDSVLRDGSGEQWDSDVVDAVFRVREAIREIGRSDRVPQVLNVQEWHT